MKVTRRTFVKTAAAGGAAAAIGVPQLGNLLEAVAAPVVETKMSFCDNSCGHHCGRQVDVADGRIVAVRGEPLNRFSLGKLCVKGLTVTGEAYSPHRILHPMKRVGDDWVQTTWDEALGAITDELRSIRRTRRALPGREGLSDDQIRGRLTEDETLAVACYTTPRTRAEGNSMLFRFRHAYGARPHWGGCQTCAGNFTRAQRAIMGLQARTNHDPDLRQSKYIVLWAGNWAVNMPVAWQHIQAAQDAGAKVVAIDVRKTQSASKADWYLPIRPGTDGALAMGILHVLFNYKDGGSSPVPREAGDPDLTYSRLVEMVHGGQAEIDKLKTAAASYDPATVESLTWIPAADVLKLAYEIATVGKRQTAFICGSGLSAQINGFQSNRAIQLILGMVGAYGIAGGGSHAKMGSVGLPKLPTCGSGPRWWTFGGTKANDLYGPGEQPPEKTCEDILEGKVKVLFSSGNLLSSRPDTHAHREAFEYLKEHGLIVHIGMYEDESAKYAHYILPLASELEEAGSNHSTGSTGALTWKEQVIPGIGETHAYWWIWNEIGHRVFNFDDDGNYRQELCTLTTNSTGSDNPEYNQPLWPYDAFKDGSAAIYDYVWAKGYAAQGGDGNASNPFWGFRRDRLTPWAPKGGVLWPCPQSAYAGGGSPFLLKHPTDPGLAKFSSSDSLMWIDIGSWWEDGGVPHLQLGLIEQPTDTSPVINWSEDYPLYMTSNKTHAALQQWTSRWDGLTSDIVETVAIDINPDTAAMLGMADGDIARVTSPRGSVEMRVKLSERVHPKIINVPPYTDAGSPIPGYAAPTANLLTAQHGDPHTEIPGWMTGKCRIEKVA